MPFAEKKQHQKTTYDPAIDQRIERYWDKRSADFSNVRRKELQGADSRLWQELMERRLPAGKPLHILDAGTGAGFFAILLAKLGHQVTGIDMSADMLHEARKNMMEAGCRAEFRKMSAQDLVFPTGSFDAIVSRNLTWTLPDVMEAYREWHRVLKPGGLLMNFDSDYGQVVFSQKDEQKDVHAGIARELVQECNDIKDELRISTHQRPAWDISYLESLGFQVTSDADVAPLVRRDKNLHFDPFPLFGIYAKKPL